MKKVIKVSIGNMAFTLEEDAYSVINDYLTSLNDHYSSNPSGDEIIDGIEERMAELLLEKSGEDKIVSLSEANEVINILGRPEAIDQESGLNDKRGYSEGRRQFFRDPSNRILGGVCSGLGEYFNRDATLFRVLFALSTIVFSIFSWGIGGGFFIVVYILLWIIIPDAKTVEQRCAMRGEKPSVQSIQNNVEKGMKEFGDSIKRVGENTDFWETIGNVFVRVCGFIFTLVGVGGLICCVIAFFSVKFMGLSFPFDMMPDGIWLKVLVMLLCFIPFIALLYSGIMMLFNFKSPKWKPGLIMFIIWLLSILGVAVYGVSKTSQYWDSKYSSSSQAIPFEGDTLYVEYSDIEKWEDKKILIDADRNSYEFIFVDNINNKDIRVAQYPSLHLLRINNTDNIEIEAETHYFPSNTSFQEVKDISMANFYTINGNTLVLDPLYYEKGVDVKEVNRSVDLRLREDVVVIVRKPIYHQFNSHFEYSNIKWINKWKKCDDLFDFDFDF